MVTGLLFGTAVVVTAAGLLYVGFRIADLADFDKRLVSF